MLRQSHNYMLSSLILLLVITLGAWCFLTDLKLSFLRKDLHKRDLPQWVLQAPIAHRGLHHHPDVPENSLAAFQYAKESQFGIELDVHLTMDGKVVVFHDENLNRIGGVDQNISELTYEEILNIKLLKTDQKIPLLREVLALVDGKVPVFVEIKNSWGNVGPLELAVYQIIQDYQGPLAIISFNPPTLQWFKLHAPEIIRGQTASAFDDPEDQSLPLFKKLGMKFFLYNWLSQPDFLIYDLKTAPFNLSLSVLKRTKPVITYGVKNKADLIKAQLYSLNYMFDHVSEEIIKQQAIMIDLNRH